MNFTIFYRKLLSIFLSPQSIGSCTDEGQLAVQLLKSDRIFPQNHWATSFLWQYENGCHLVGFYVCVSFHKFMLIKCTCDSILWPGFCIVQLLYTKNLFCAYKTKNNSHTISASIIVLCNEHIIHYTYLYLVHHIQTFYRCINFCLKVNDYYLIFTFEMNVHLI